MPVFDPKPLWDKVTTFFNFLDDFSRDMVENFWYGLSLTSTSLTEKSRRFFNADSPENSETDVTEKFYEIQVGPLFSFPLKLDPTDIRSNHIITPLSRVIIEPTYTNGEPVYSDLVEIGALDYYSIRDVGIGTYAVVSVSREGVNNRYYKVKNLLSSEETALSGRYYNASAKIGAVDDPTKYKYMVELEDADLSYIGEDTFTIYLTTGRTYKVDNYVKTVPELRSHIGIYQETHVGGESFKIDTDYSFDNEYVEFIDNIFDITSIQNGDVLYCPEAEIIEYNLFNMYGNLVSKPDWNRYNYNNVSGKAAVNALLKSIQNSSNANEYEKALNVHYGLPVAPQKCKVIGLYESYDYEVIDIVGNTITLDLLPEQDLHNFFQVNSKIIIDGKNEEVTVTAVVDRATGEITVDDVSNIDLGDKVNLKLINKYDIDSITAETPSTDGYVKIGSSESAGRIQHIIDIITLITESAEYPEFIIYGTDGFSVNYDGIYHVTSATDEGGGIVKLSIYNSANDDEPRYNDFVFITSADMGIGYVHIPWPTHKYLLLLLEDGTYHKSYIDSPLDTIYDEGDFLDKYTHLCRNVSALNSSTFKNWNEFEGFRRYNDIDADANILELINVIPNTKFGKHFPSEYEAV